MIIIVAAVAYFFALCAAVSLSLFEIIFVQTTVRVFVDKQMLSSVPPTFEYIFFSDASPIEQVGLVFIVLSLLRFVSTFLLNGSVQLFNYGMLVTLTKRLSVSDLNRIDDLGSEKILSVYFGKVEMVVSAIAFSINNIFLTVGMAGFFLLLNPDLAKLNDVLIFGCVGLFFSSFIFFIAYKIGGKISDTHNVYTQSVVEMLDDIRNLLLGNDWGARQQLKYNRRFRQLRFLGDQIQALPRSLVELFIGFLLVFWLSEMFGRGALDSGSIFLGVLFIIRVFPYFSALLSSLTSLVGVIPISRDIYRVLKV